SVLAFAFGWVKPLINTGSVMSGNAPNSADRVIVQIFSGPPLQPGSVSGMLKAIVSTAGETVPATHLLSVSLEAMFILAAMIASRNVQALSLSTASPVLV